MLADEGASAASVNVRAREAPADAIRPLHRRSPTRRRLRGIERHAGSRPLAKPDRLRLARKSIPRCDLAGERLQQQPHRLLRDMKRALHVAGLPESLRHTYAGCNESATSGVEAGAVAIGTDGGSAGSLVRILALVLVLLA